MQEARVVATTTETPSTPLAGSVERDRGERPSGALARLGRAAAVLVVVLLAGLIGYAAGHMQVAQRLDRAWAEHADQLAAEARAQRALEERTEALSQRVRLLEGARQITRAERALEARNFGIAETHLRQAEQSLRELDDVEGAPELATRIGSTRVVVAEDIESQRDQLIALSERADALIARREPLTDTEADPR